MYVLKIKNLNVEKSFENISEIKDYVQQLHDENHWIAGSTWEWNNSFVYKDGKKIGTVSFNGRVWDINDSDKEILG